MNPRPNPGQAARIRRIQATRRAILTAKKATQIGKKYGEDHPAAEAANKAVVKHLQNVTAEGYKEASERGDKKRKEQMRRTHRFLTELMEE